MTTAIGSSGFGVKEHGFLADVVMATSMKTGRRANCGLVTDGEMVTSLVLHGVVPPASVTRVVMPAGMVGFGVVGAGDGAAVGVAVGGSAVTVAVLVGFGPSDPSGQTWTTTHATRIAAARRSSHRRTYTERGCCLLTAPR